MVAIVLALDIITDQSSVRESESYAILLRDNCSGDNLRIAHAVVELVRVGESLNGCTEFLSRIQIQILHIIGVLW